MKRALSCAALAGAAAGLVSLSGAAIAADHTNLEEGLPVITEDAYPLKQGALEVQGYARFDHLRDDPRGPSRWTLTPRVEYGLANAQVSIETPYRLGDASDTKQGEARVQGLYNFNEETTDIPAIAVAAGITRPFGRDAGGTESELKLLATKSLPPFDVSGSWPLSYVPRRLHLNASWFHNYDPDRSASERRDRYRVGVAYSQPLGNHIVAVTDVYRETDRRPGSATNLVEGGLRYVITPQTVISGGIGVGFGSSSERFRAVVAIQHTLSVPFAP